MDAWLHRSKFQDRVKAYQAATGATQEGVAQALGTTVGTLRGWLYNRNRKPSIETLQRAAALFSCSVTEFMDDPGAAVAGQSLEGLSETRRFVARLMLEDLKAEDLSDDDVRILMEDHQRALERLRALKGRTGK